MTTAAVLIFAGLLLWIGAGICARLTRIANALARIAAQAERAGDIRAWGALTAEANGRNRRHEDA